MLQEAIKDKVEKYFDKVKVLADHLTDHPEISGEEKESCAYITDFLGGLGYEITAPYAGMPHSFLAVDRERKDFKGPKAAFLCEYDALPDVGHACGHSYSCAISILGALALREAYPDLPVRIDLIGTPGEEFVGGKCYMTGNGGFDGCEYAAMVHLNNENVTYFQVLASNDRYFTFHGKAAHASACPEEGLNALNAARFRRRFAWIIITGQPPLRTCGDSIRYPKPAPKELPWPRGPLWSGPSGIRITGKFTGMTI